MGSEMGQDAAGVQGLDQRSRVGEVLRAAGRGAVGAMAMTGMRVMTTELGLVEQTPPAAVSRHRARGALAADHVLYGLVLSGMRRNAGG